MLIMSLDDLIIKKTKIKRISKNTKIITNITLYSGLGVLIGTGVISIALVGNCIALGCIAKVTKIAIKKSGIVNKVMVGKTVKNDLKLNNSI